MFDGEVITGPKGGHIAVVSNAEDCFEVHPLGDSRHREFYLKASAEDVAASHSAYLNRGGKLYSSFVRR